MHTESNFCESPWTSVIREKSGHLFKRNRTKTTPEHKQAEGGGAAQRSRVQTRSRYRSTFAHLPEQVRAIHRRDVRRQQLRTFETIIIDDFLSKQKQIAAARTAKQAAYCYIEQRRDPPENANNLFFVDVQFRRFAASSCARPAEKSNQSRDTCTCDRLTHAINDVAPETAKYQQLFSTMQKSDY